MHDVAVLHHIVLAFETEFAGIARPRFWERAQYYGDTGRLAEALSSAEVSDGLRIIPSIPAVVASPRRTSRDRSRSRPRESRLSTVPTGQPSI